MEQAVPLHHEEVQKSHLAFRTISEVSQEIDVPQHVLRFWESRFSQIRPLKRGGGRRYYRPEDIELLRCIKNYLYKQGYTIKGVQRLLKESRRALDMPPAENFRRASELADEVAQDIPPEDFSEVFGEGMAEAIAQEKAAASQADDLARRLEAVEAIHDEIENPPQPMRMDAGRDSNTLIPAKAGIQNVDSLTAEAFPLEARGPVSRLKPAPAFAKAEQKELRAILGELLTLRDMLRGVAE